MIETIAGLVPQPPNLPPTRSITNPLRYVDVGIALCLVIVIVTFSIRWTNNRNPEVFPPEPLAVPTVTDDGALQTVMPRHPGNPIAESCLRQGMLELGRGNPNVAEAWFLKAQATDPQHPKFTLALERFKRGRREQDTWSAIQEVFNNGDEDRGWQTFVEQSHSRSFFQQWAMPMIRNLEQRQRSASAAAILQTWLKIHPNDAVARSKLERHFLAIGISKARTLHFIGELHRGK